MALRPNVRKVFDFLSPFLKGENKLEGQQRKQRCYLSLCSRSHLYLIASPESIWKNAEANTSEPRTIPKWKSEQGLNLCLDGREPS